MGAIANFAELPVDRWSAALSAVAEAGVELDDQGVDREMRVYVCRHERSEVVLMFGHVLPDVEQGVCMYSPVRSWWWRPLGMRRVSRVVWAAVLASGGKSV